MTDNLTESDVRAICFGQKLQKLREEQGYSRKEFSKIAGLHYVSLFQWERGKNIKSIVKFFQLCEKLNVRPDYFIKDDWLGCD